VAHDCVQETFLRVWERRGALQPELSFPGLLFRIGLNLARDHARRRRTHERLRDGIPPPSRSERDDPAQALALTLLEEELLKVLNAEIPERCRTILLLSRFEGMSNGAIAELLGLSPKTVENQVTRGLSILKRRLRRFLSPPSEG
jgi:RNA polymerase sigma-70 factor (ECF subfamily)